LKSLGNDLADLLRRRRAAEKRVLSNRIIRKAYKEKNPACVQIRFLGVPDDHAIKFTHNLINHLKKDYFDAPSAPSAHQKIKRFLRFSLNENIRTANKTAFDWRELDEFGDRANLDKRSNVYTLSSPGLSFHSLAKSVDANFSNVTELLGKRVGFVYLNPTDSWVLASGRVNRVWGTGFRVMTDSGEHRSYSFAKTDNLIKIPNKAPEFKVLTVHCGEFMEFKLTNFNDADPRHFYDASKQGADFRRPNRSKYGVLIAEQRKLAELWEKQSLEEFTRDVAPKSVWG